MDLVQNPYSPNAGAPPPALVGRDGLLNGFRAALARIVAARSAKSQLVTGLRGVGKTVLLNRRTWIQQNNGVAENVYKEAVDKYNLRKMISPGDVIYGEIYGDGIQAGYTYGCKPGERKLAVFDIMRNGQYLSFMEFDKAATAAWLTTVPKLFMGFYDPDFIRELTKGPSVLAPTQKVREGNVVKTIIEEEHPHFGRKILKFISDEYLLKDNTDFH